MDETAKHFSKIAREVGAKYFLTGRGRQHDDD
jgi:hypothetical protein